MPNALCPHCHQQGEPVQTTTVQALVTDEFRHLLVEGPYYLCQTPDCGVGYYGPTEAAVLHPYQLKAPLHFKTGAHPRYACYCNKVTEDEVFHTVREKGLVQMQAIIRSLRGEAQSDCRHKNPLGRCCSERFHELIDLAKKAHKESSSDEI